MIESTFLLAPGIGPKRERAIWDDGVGTWGEFLSRGSVRGVGPRSKPACDRAVEAASELLRAGDCRGLGAMLPRGEQWRLFGRFGGGAAFLDLETDGLERDSLVTAVTVHRAGRTETLVRGRGLDEEALADALDGCSMLVTFNGSCFDLPVLRCSFPGLDLGMPHFDLRFGCRRVGLRGGLKGVERALGMAREDGIAEVDGMEAVRLWRRWARDGDAAALDTLAEYNRADAVNLAEVAAEAYRRLVDDARGPRVP